MKSTLPSPVRSRAFPLIPTERPATWVSVLPSPDVSTPAGVVHEHAAEHVGELGKHVAATEQDVKAREQAQPDAVRGVTDAVALAINAL
eukprot:scaffold80544_cov61-Phaeocystis_antarctica.AAC.5